MTPSGSSVIGDCAANCPTKNFNNVQNLTKKVLSDRIISKVYYVRTTDFN